MEKVNFVILSVAYKPFLGIVNDGCSLTGTRVVIVKNRTKVIWKVLFRFFAFLKLNSLAIKCKMSNYEDFFRYLNDSSIKFLFWGQHYINWWLVFGKKLTTQKKCIFCWGPCGNTKNIKKKKKEVQMAHKGGFDLYTMDPKDADEYNMVLTTQFYRFFNEVQQKKVTFDFYFCGLKKNREKYLEILEDELRKKGYQTNFILVENERGETSFLDNVSRAKQAKCIVDVVATENKFKQSGATLRPLEALFLGKKLITNYQDIIKCDFYHPNNIFIISFEKLELKGIDDFIEKPLHVFDKKIYEKYEVNEWLRKNFLDCKV